MSKLSVSLAFYCAMASMGSLADSGCCPQASQTAAASASVDPDIMGLTKGDAKNRMDSAERLGKGKTREAVPALIHALDDSDPYVQSVAAWALGEIGDVSIVGEFIDAMARLKRKVDISGDRREAKPSPSFADALKKLTGQDLGMDAAAWKRWRENQGTKQLDEGK